MIEVVHGDVFDLHKGIIAHGCNAQGVMGAGIALSIKNRYPKAFSEYRNLYVANGNELPMGYAQRVKVSDDLIIYNLITQDNFGTPSLGIRWCSYDAIDGAFNNMFAEIAHGFNPRKSLPTVTIPQIGAGLGGGDWPTIRRIIDHASDNYSIPVQVVIFKK